MKTLPELIAEAAVNVRRLPVKDALAEIKSAQTPLLIDVREPAEAAQTPNPEAEVIPRGVLEMQLLNRAIPADTPIYLHCATGGRATLAAEQLQRIGFTHVTAISCPITTIVNAQ
ncbi:Uncharacterised protein [BD1-7 clade bacterium]|uniref:Rhodanese domain-containing protein n=1 Tax=BD1-7 clade bacterium TaxID=2029982 RepID=A0A5S9P6R7_9GAMM|nr:Uncharacterised protein [BD1-7 clade bacterium]CAA0099273.1 Uncharacterised protein [BD1-7 clade bacterium]